MTGMIHEKSKKPVKLPDIYLRTLLDQLQSPQYPLDLHIKIIFALFVIEIAKMSDSGGLGWNVLL